MTDAEAIRRALEGEYVGGVAPLLAAEVERLKSACARDDHEIQQVLGKALGYPRYCDDQTNFPGATEADGCCVGPHVAATLAMEAADRIERLTRERDAALAIGCMAGRNLFGLPDDVIFRRLGESFKSWMKDDGKAERDRVVAGILAAYRKAAGPKSSPTEGEGQ